MEKALPTVTPGFLRSRPFALPTEPNNARIDDSLQSNTNWTITKHYLGHILPAKTFNSFCRGTWGRQHYPLVLILHPASGTQNFSHIESHGRRT